MKPNVKDLSSRDLGKWLVQKNEPAYRAQQIHQWLFQKGAASFSEMTNLSGGLRSALEQDFSIAALRLVRKSDSTDGTEKFLFDIGGGATIESVLIPETKRLTLCVSTQAGCGLGCVFCATARMGLARNLTATEIVEQVLEARRFSRQGRPITNLVFMGMGEPLANYDHTCKAIDLLTDVKAGLGFSPRRITLSTVGLIPQIRRLMEETRVNLAISLHAAKNDVRAQLMPINRKYPLQDLIECCRSLPLPRRKRITFEYVLLRGINDSAEDAASLAILLYAIRCKINLIPFNPHPQSPYQSPNPAEIERFQNILRDKGLQVNVRQPRGPDIQAACGQLATAAREPSGTRQVPRASLPTPHA